MNPKDRIPIYRRIKLVFIGKARNLHDEDIFKKLTLIAFFAWIGLGSDGLSSSCYGPEESYRVLGHYHSLSIFVGLMIALTILIISSSYSQIIRLFPSGGGGYKVATKLLTPKLGMISGCALLVDYVLTIAVSIASGTDALFSLFPERYQPFKIFVASLGIVVLIVLNLRGIKESVYSLMPIFILFVVTHALLILVTLIQHVPEVPAVYNDAVNNFHQARQSFGLMGVLFIVLRSYSMGAGTYTGLEAVSNSVPILKEPREKTGLTTMRYMATSLGITVLGLFLAYSIFKLQIVPGKTLNAVLLESFTAGWGHGWGVLFVLITLLSEAALLFIAAQTGFLDGPRVIGSMAQDSWFPRKFTVLSDRLVTQNGILLMGTLAILVIWITGSSVQVLVVLYSINVFITFALSQSGMVRHWWLERRTEKKWKRKLSVNGIGLIITVFILFSVVIMKFTEGGWITILITSSLIFIVMSVKRHYKYSDKLVNRLNCRMLQKVSEIYSMPPDNRTRSVPVDLNAKTAVICVNGYNGLGIASFLKVHEEFAEFRNIVFLEVGMVDSSNFRGNTEMNGLEEKIKKDLASYKQLAEHFGYHTWTYYALGTDVADEIKEMAKTIKSKFHNTVFFIGQFLLPRPTAFQRLLHNQTQLAIHNRLSHKGFIMVLIPIRSHIHI